MAESLSSVSVGVSNANLSPQQALLWGVWEHRQYLEAIGADGFEWMPIRSRLRLEPEIGRASLSDVVTSLHASFRSQTAGDVLRGRGSPRTLPFIAGMSRLDTLAPLVVMQHKVGRQLSVVAYPNEQVPPNPPDTPRPVDYASWQSIFKSVRFQPTAELLHSWGVLSADGDIAMEGMKHVMEGRGFNGVCFDNFHWKSERSGHMMPDWARALPNIIRDGTAQEMHVCPARPDRGGGDEQLQLILDGRIGETEVGYMITCIAENLPFETDFDFVLELPHVAVGHDDIGVSRAVIGAIRDHFSSPA
jgi:hypothetical protein